MKRTCLYLSMLMVLCLSSLPALAVDFTVDELKFSASGNTASVVGPADKSSLTGALEIPSTVTYDGVDYSVTSIGETAFYDCSSLTTVTIPESVTYIESCAFQGCSSLTAVTIPESVTTIGDYAFEECSSLTSITIPESVTYIGAAAFSACDGLNSFSGKFASADHRCLIVDGVLTSFAPAGLTSYKIPESVTSIGDDAFLGCSSLTSVTIPNSVASIESYAFFGCSSLTSVTIPESVTAIGAWTFQGCSSLTSVTIPESVTSIGDYAFQGCSSLTSVTIPESVTAIGYGVFYRCDGLKSFSGKFASADHRCLIVDGVLTSFAPAGLTSYKIPESVTSIGVCAFRSCSSLTSVTIPESVTSIGTWAFEECTSLTSVIIPNSVTSIESYAFYRCHSLTSVTIPESVTAIGMWAFAGCSLLTSVTIPESVTSIGGSAFHSCSSLTYVIIPNSVTSIGESAFAGCNKLKEIFVEALTPPDCEDNVFENVDLSQCTLYVLEQALSLYQYTYPWCDMANIAVNRVNRDFGLSLSQLPLPKGKSVAMPVMLTNPENVVTVQFDLFLPEGVTLDTDEYGDFIITPGERCNSTHIFSSGTVGDCIRVVGYSSRNRPYADSEEPLIYLPLTASADLPTGSSLPIEMRNILFTIEDGLKEIQAPNYHGMVEIIEPFVRGDVNDDGIFSATDIAYCLSFILGKPVEDAVSEAADVNNDGTITANDIALIVALIIPQDDSPKTMAPRREPRAETAAPAYYLNPIETRPESDTTLEVGLRNPDTQAITLQCDISLPEGVEIETDEFGEPIVNLSPGRSAGHTIVCGRLADGTYRIVSYSNHNRPYKETDGVIFTIPLKVNKPVGEYDIILSKSSITDAATFKEIFCPDTSTTLTVTNGGTTGIDAIEADNANAEYFSLQGVKVNVGSLVPGVYIRRTGNVVEKVIVK